MRKPLAIVICVSLLLWGGNAAGQSQKSADEKSDSQSTVRTEKRGAFRLGGLTVGAGYTGFFSSPWRYRPWPPFVRSFYFTGFDSFHPGFRSGFSYRAGMGQIKLRTDRKEAHVFIDGGFAGLAKDLKTIWLDAGVYEIRIEEAGYQPVQNKLYILSGKKLVLETILTPERGEHQP
jgi:hypothetical protein